MLHIPWMVILGDQNMMQTSFENFDSSPAHGEKLHKQLVYQSVENPPLPPPVGRIPKQGEINVETASDMLYIPWMVIWGDHNIINTSFETFNF